MITCVSPESQWRNPRDTDTANNSVFGCSRSGSGPIARPLKLNWLRWLDVRINVQAVILFLDLDTNSYWIRSLGEVSITPDTVLYLKGIGNHCQHVLMKTADYYYNCLQDLTPSLSNRLFLFVCKWLWKDYKNLKAENKAAFCLLFCLIWLPPVTDVKLRLPPPPLF